jgi:hypothetical protein
MPLVPRCVPLHTCYPGPPSPPARAPHSSCSPLCAPSPHHPGTIPVCSDTNARAPTIKVSGNTSLLADDTYDSVNGPGAWNVLTLVVDDDVTGIGLSYTCTINGASISQGSLATGKYVPASVTKVLDRYRFPVGSTTVTCTVTDCKNNKASGDIVVTVVDTVPPRPSPVQSWVFNATSLLGYSFMYALPSATDNVQQFLNNPVCTPGNRTMWAINDATNPVHTVRCVFTDQAGNTAETSFTIKVCSCFTAGFVSGLGFTAGVHPGFRYHHECMPLVGCLKGWVPAHVDEACASDSAQADFA